jgi:hypothetical protein
MSDRVRNALHNGRQHRRSNGSGTNYSGLLLPPKRSRASANWCVGRKAIVAKLDRLARSTRNLFNTLDAISKLLSLPPPLW